MRSRSDAIARVRRRLAPFPAIGRVFDHCLDRLIAARPLGIALYGSLARGAVDHLSDIDLAVVVQDRRSFRRMRASIVAAVRGAGRLLAGFPATHVGLPDLTVLFLEVDGRIVRVDVHLATLAGYRAARRTTILYDPRRRLAAGQPRRSPRPPRPDFDGMFHRFTGLAWHAFVRLERGDRLEAVDTLGLMRTQVLVPCLRAVEGLPPQPSYRGLERALSRRGLAALRRTHPRGFEGCEIRRALRAACSLFERLRGRLGRRARGGPVPADFAAIARVIRADGRTR